METKNKSTLLHDAAQEGSITKINILLNHGADINSTHGDFKNTPLNIACWFGHSRCVKKLIHSGAQLDIPNSCGSTSVHIASWKNEAKCLKTLLKNGTPFCTKNTTGLGNTPLYLASKAGSTESVKILLHYIGNNHAEIDCECAEDNSTALQAAGINEHAQCYWDLVMAGADYTKKIDDNNTLSSISDIINIHNRPFKKFVSHIESFGKDKPFRFYGHLYTYCFLCIEDFVPNDVVIQIKECAQTFHASCFENYCVRYFIEKSKNKPWIASFKKDTSDKEFEHFIKTNRAGNVPLADQCPHCHISFDPQRSLSMGVFS